MIVSALFISLLFVSCNETSDKKSTDETKVVEAVTSFDIDGKYMSEDGDLEFKSSRDKTNTSFTLLVVNSQARTGEAEGDFTLNDNNTAMYKTEGCKLEFSFTKSNVTVKQEGSCDMGMNVNASGVYKKS